MKVYVCFDYFNDLCNIHVYFAKIVSDEQKAIDWCSKIARTEFVWRDYRLVDVE